MIGEFLNEEEDLGKAYDARLLRRFLSYLVPHWKPVALTLLIMFLSIAIELTAPFLLKAALDGPVASKDASALWLYGAAFLAIASLTGLFQGLEHYCSNLAGQRIIFDLRTQAVTEKIQDTSQFPKVRADIARILTEISARRKRLMKTA